MEEFARLLLAFLAVALLINLVKSGPHGVWNWLSLKFLGRPTKKAG